MREQLWEGLHSFQGLLLQSGDTRVKLFCMFRSKRLSNGLLHPLGWLAGWFEF